MAILRCAAEVFSERPYHEVLTDEISARLKIGKGTLYRYFTSKEELYFASIVDGLQGMQEAIDATLRQNAPLEQHHRGAGAHDHRLLLAAARLLRPALSPRSQARPERTGRMAEGARDDGQHRRRSGWRPSSAAASMRAWRVEMLFGMIRSVCLYRDESARLDDLARLVAAVFLSGVRVKHGRRMPHAVERRRAAAGRGSRRWRTRRSLASRSRRVVARRAASAFVAAWRDAQRRAPRARCGTARRLRRPGRLAGRRPTALRAADRRCRSPSCRWRRGRPSGCSSSSARCSATKR